MKSVTMHEAKARLSQLIARAAKGESFIIAKSGKPMVRLVAIDKPSPDSQKRTGFLQGQFSVPENFDRMGEDTSSELLRVGN